MDSDLPFEEIEEKNSNADDFPNSSDEMVDDLRTAQPSEFVQIDSLLFSDGNRSVDFVLVWKTAIEDTEEGRCTRRAIFEQNLIKEGLELEREILEGEITFVKVSKYCTIFQVSINLELDYNEANLKFT